MAALRLIRFLRSELPDRIEEWLARDRVIRRARGYAEEGRVDEVWVEQKAIRAHVSGSADTPYLCVLTLHENDLESRCSCPFSRGTCWHVGALLYTLAEEPSLFDRLEAEVETGKPSLPTASASEGGKTEGQSGEGSSSGGRAQPTDSATALVGDAVEYWRNRLLVMPKGRLAEILAESIAGDPLLQADLEPIALESSDTDIRLFRQAARAALRPGQTLGRYEVPRVASDLRHIADSAGRLVSGGHPEEALDLLGEMAWMAWHRVEDVDDREGALTGVVREILFRWCRYWAKVEGRDRQALAREIFGWLMEDEGLLSEGLILEARSALGKLGLDALEGLLRPMIDERLRSRPARLGADGETSHADPFLARVRRALRESAEAREDLDAFLALCSAEGEHGEEVLAAARHLVEQGRNAEALDWIDRGARKTRGPDRVEIEDLRIEVLAQLDRHDAAADAAWKVFQAEPGVAAYRRLLGVVPQGERGEWRRRALDHAEAAADATAFVEVCTAAADVERFCHRLDSSASFVLAAGTSALERAVGILDDRVHWAAARVHLHLAGRFLSDGDPRLYGRAKNSLRRAQASFLAGDDPEGWAAAFERISRAHMVVRSWFALEADAPVEGTDG